MRVQKYGSSEPVSTNKYSHVPHEKHIYKFLSNGTVVEMNVDGAASTTTFKYTATGDSVIVRVNLLIMDTATAPSKFGGIASLTTGLEIGIFDSDGTQVLDFTDGQPIKTNADFGLLAGTDSVIDAGAGDDAASIRWTIAKSGSPGWLPKDYYIAITILDDLTGISSFRAQAQGIKQYSL